MNGVRAALRLADRQLVRTLSPRRRREWLYLRVHRRLPRVDDPRTFTEKVTWRILHDRRPELSWTCDKLAMKEHASSSGVAVRVPRTLWVGTDVRELHGVDLPPHWVLKPIHRSGLVYFGNGRTEFGALADATSGWLVDHQNDHLAEWAYGQARRGFLVEEMLGVPGSPPRDYKFFVFDGVPRLVQVDVDRFSGHRRSLYTPDWVKLDVTLNHPDGGPVRRPHVLSEMLRAAAELGRDFDFIRIDLYDVDGEVVLGEYTPYPSSGLERFDPRSLDAQLGSFWRLPRLPASDR